MKKLLFLLVVTFFFHGCGSFMTFSSANITTNAWIGEPILDSQIDTSGNVFFKRTLSDGTTLGLLYDELTEKDGGFVYTTLMNDFGWYWNGSKWDGNVYLRTTKLGHMYINPSKGLALHFNFENEYRAFKVKVLN